MNLVWYHWAILGVALMVAELVAPAFVLVWFGLGALVVALLVALIPQTGFSYQMLVWVIASSLLVVLWFKVFKPNQSKILSGRSQAQTVGEVGLVVAATAPFQKGQIRFQTPMLGSDVWECVSDDTIAIGERAKVMSVEGSFVKISKEHKQ